MISIYLAPFTPAGPQFYCGLYLVADDYCSPLNMGDTEKITPLLTFIEGVVGPGMVLTVLYDPLWTGIGFDGWVHMEHIDTVVKTVGAENEF